MDAHNAMSVNSHLTYKHAKRYTHTNMALSYIHTYIYTAHMTHVHLLSYYTYIYTYINTYINTDWFDLLPGDGPG